MVIAILSSMAAPAFAVARPGHQHEDLFGESDLLLGFRGGPQLTGYTTIQTPSAVVSVQSSMRFVAGFAAEFIYDLPRFEIDMLLSARGGLNTADTLFGLAFPVLAKIPWEVEPNTDIEFGAGVEVDHLMFGADPHDLWLIGILGSVGLQHDFKNFVFDFEVRYNLGLDNLAQNVNGARPRDFQIIGGILWHF